MSEQHLEIPSSQQTIAAQSKPVPFVYRRNDGLFLKNDYDNKGMFSGISFGEFNEATWTKPEDSICSKIVVLNRILKGGFDCTLMVMKN